jgi:hypothetical protein
MGRYDHGFDDAAYRLSPIVRTVTKEPAGLT